MPLLALASDYDGTLAHDGVVDEPTLQALETFRRSGRKLILVTGRELADLATVFSHFEIFDRIVAENGAVLFNPATGEKRILGDRPNPRFLAALERRGVQPISLGDVIVATRRPNETTVLEVIRDLGLELQVVFNKGSVMVLPPRVNKVSGLKEALAELGLSERNVAGVGDAENDHAFLRFCGFSAAVANALPSVKETATYTTRADHGAGVVELVDMILNGKLASYVPA
jgi:hydroxymethylpyrimidine pyrophosphatase-like HAD family hydrolase